ncbi:hypothetical protein AYO44_13035 [Planctomycetaceae bacterium SCGC AG-212-F19]|nr:hypothetical protein AYO44_13035 [Planctomycetaceae bacterium SCGC AG-212-F19]
MIQIRVMTASDVPLGMRLKAEAGWNQLEADWHRFLDMQPDGCFVAELNGVPVGTTVTCIFDSIAWIAMVLVDAEERSQGIGKALMQHALTFLEAKAIPTIRLDATALGQPLYEKLGFVADYTLHRYDGVLSLPPDVQPDARVLDTSGEDGLPLYGMVELDRAVTRTNREKLLRRLCRPEAGVRWVMEGNDLLGYMTIRDGSNAVQLGPCIANAFAGPLLMADAWERYLGNRVFIDIPTGNAPALEFAEAMGLKVQRPLVRMTRGPRVAEDVARLWASSGPELG